MMMNVELNLTTHIQIDLILEFRLRLKGIKKITNQKRSMLKDLRSQIERSTKIKERLLRMI